MRVRNYKDESSRKINPMAPHVHLSQEKTGNRSKFNTSMERQIERLWIESNKLDWNFNDFVVDVLGVLVVLNHRNKVKSAISSQPKKNRDIPS